MNRALYVGSFDPPTNGHLWVIEQASRLADSLVVAVGTNALKAPFCPSSVRVELLRQCVAHLGNVEVREFPGRYTVLFAQEVGATHLIRGLRSSVDFESERTIQLMNADIADVMEVPSPVSLFLMPPKDLSEVSSSLVRQVMGPPGKFFTGWEAVVERYVPPAVFSYLASVFPAA